jgi:hypothetical protein
MAGYSSTPLLDKLGIRESMRVLLINPPVDYFELIGKDLGGQVCKKGERADFVHLFAKSYAIFETRMWDIAVLMKPTTIIWVSWYKKSSGISTDITENRIRDYALAHELVDIKVCAVSDVWSGLKLVVPLHLRKK